MQTVETLNEGLKRAYTLTITAAEIEARVAAELKRVAPQIRMPGFRPGKVPANLVRKMHGPALAQDALNASVQEGIQALIAERALRPALQPSVALDQGYEPGADAQITVTLEVLPDVPTPRIEGLSLERLIVPVPAEAVDAQLMRFAEQQKRYDDAPEGHAAATGDLVVMDFVGKVEGVAFEGGTGEDMAIEIGSGRLIPGFEDQLIGAVKGEERRIAVTFPEDYNVETLKGKAATFDLAIKDVRLARPPVIDEELATSLGLQSLEQLRGLLQGQIEQEHNQLTRTYMKRKLLDQLAAGHDFPVPPSMVEAEFEQIWAQLEHEATHEADPAKARAEMEAEREDYQRIAERRVRLGLLLSEIGQQNGVEVTQAEMNRLVAEAARQYQPEERQRFIQYIQQEPMAAAQLRAPLYEDKVVDWLFERAEISEREVTREELEAAIESDDGFATGTHIHNHDHDHDHDHQHHDAAPVDADGAAVPVEPVPAGDSSAELSASNAPVEPVKKPARRKKAEGAEATDASDDAGGEPAPARKPRKKKAEAADDAA